MDIKEKNHEQSSDHRLRRRGLRCHPQVLSGTRGVHRDLHRQPYQSKCDKLAAELAPKTATKITTAQVDADKVDEVIALIKLISDPVMNIALPYQT